jgi:vacuolar protein sorting-associated protein 8
MTDPLTEDDDGTRGAMADREDLSPAGEHASSSDDETVKGERDETSIVEMWEEEMEAPTTPIELGNGTVANRYRQILQDQQDDVSEEGSVDAVPGRAPSPIDSLLSVPDDSPSVQVCLGL